MSYRYIAFDLDGTLVDSLPALAQATNAMLAELGRDTQSQAQVGHWVGNGISTLVKRALGGEPDAGLFEQGLDSFQIHYRAHLVSGTRPYQGVRELLADLHGQGIRLALITNKARRFTEPLLAGLDLAQYFELVLAGDDLAEKKPHPAPLLHLCEQWQLTPEQLLMVGDSRNDIQAAKAAGCASAGLTAGYNYGEDIRLCEPDWVLDAVTELRRLPGLPISN
ncbi:phosphoglycolate phosphatase [Gallaecimonas sp. GXIMD4217]|uniref:phosphoglycolate phosphatase n=1 Tax=Gallaecimonas sp. GXIMD4217 TaxID=3131927 RepID=UPI00311ACAEA